MTIGLDMKSSLRLLLSRSLVALTAVVSVL